MSGRAAQLLRLNLPSVKSVGDPDLHWGLVRTLSLIVDIMSGGIPDHIPALPGKGFIPLHIFNILQIRSVCNGPERSCILQPVRDHDRLLPAGGICEDVDRLLLLYAITGRIFPGGPLTCLRHCRHAEGQSCCSHHRSHLPDRSSHISSVLFILFIFYS